MRKIIKYIYCCVMIVIFLLINPILNYLNFSDKYTVLNEILRLENDSLKEEINELSHIDYSNFNYELSKVTIKNLYNKNSYYLISESKFDEFLPVIGMNGLIGITSTNNYFKGLNELTLSVKIDNDKLILVNGIINTYTDKYNIGDVVYSSGLTNIPKNIKIGFIKSKEKINEEYRYMIELNNVENNYVAVLKEKI